MKVKVLLFAQLREFFGAAERAVTVKEGTTISELGSQILKEAELEIPFLYAVNEAYVEKEYRLNEGDEVALMPPVQGG